jgi:hypothetical protein
LDAVSRFIPGVVGKNKSVEQDSFEGGLLKAPQYTRPQVWEGVAVPDTGKNRFHRLFLKQKKTVLLFSGLKEIKPPTVHFLFPDYNAWWIFFPCLNYCRHLCMFCVKGY